MAEHNDFGRWGEQKAADHLTAEGYRVMERDWRHGHRDIDIIAADGGELVFVEVKTRRGNTPVSPELAVDRRKMKSMATAANAYVKTRRIGLPLRFDIIAVTGDGGESCTINHIKDAFKPLPY